MLGDAPGEAQGAFFRGCRRALRDDAKLLVARTRSVALLHQKTARNAAHVLRALPAEIRRQAQQSPVFLLLQEHHHIGGIVRCDHHFGEHRVDPFRSGHIQRPVDRHDAAERRFRVGRKRQVIRCGKRIGRAHAAGVGVLHDRDGGSVELGHQQRSGGGIHDIVERELLAVQLREGGSP